MKTLQKVWDWLVWSSADPNQLSLTLKGYLTGVVTLATYAIGIAHVQLPAGVPEIVNQSVDGIVALGQAVAGVISAAAVVIGLFRKIYLTFKGQNQAIQP